MFSQVLSAFTLLALVGCLTITAAPAQSAGVAVGTPGGGIQGRERVPNRVPTPPSDQIVPGTGVPPS
jgi:hypothetical protein